MYLMSDMFSALKQEFGERSVFLRWPLYILPVQKLADTPAAAAAAATAAAGALGLQSLTTQPSGGAFSLRGKSGGQDLLLLDSTKSLAVLGFATSERGEKQIQFKPITAITDAPGLPVHKRYIEQLTPPGTHLDFQVHCRTSFFTVSCQT
jgi:hypothetical protein